MSRMALAALYDLRTDKMPAFSFLHRGVSSIDMGSDPGPTDAVYHYHSDYDSYHWMATYGDPGFLTHKAMGQYLTLMGRSLHCGHTPKTRACC